MRLTDLKDRKPPTPWEGETKIPWHEPGFSARMLREHLSQRHDRASRRFETIDKHAAWIHEHVLGSTSSRVLDLGCGPGFYTSRLARLGHECVGIDFSPASIAHAEVEAVKDGLSIEYRLGDVREAALGTGFDAVLVIFGEYNTFSPHDAASVLSSARKALRSGGSILLEVHAEDYVRALGHGPPTWFSADSSVFSDEPHLCLREVFWDEEHGTAIERYFIVGLDDGAMQLQRYTSTLRACTEAQYESELDSADFDDVQRHESLTGSAATKDEGLPVLVARARI